MICLDSTHLKGPLRVHFKSYLFKSELLFSRVRASSSGVHHQVGCVVPMAIVSILLHADFGPNDYREDASHFTMNEANFFFSKLKIKHYLVENSSSYPGCICENTGIHPSYDCCNFTSKMTITA